MVAIAGAVLVLLFIIISLVGLVFLIIGIVLDVTWSKKNRKQQTVSKVHKVFAVILTVLGILMGIGPSASLGVLYASQEIKEQNEISDLSESDLVYVDNIEEITDGFIFHGERYVRAIELHSATSYDSFTQNKVGAIVLRSDNSHRLLYRVDNLLNTDILYVENGSRVYVKETELDNVINYYRNNAPLRASVGHMDSPQFTRVENIDSARIRRIIETIAMEGSDTNPNSDIVAVVDRGHISFFSNDDIDKFTVDYKITSNGIILSMDGKYLVLEAEDSDYIMELINASREG